MSHQYNTTDLEASIIAALKTVYDPEIPVNVYDLGLIYELKIENNETVQITMTLTNPNCPVADVLLAEIQQSVECVEGITKAEINLVFEPEWNKEMMSDAAMLELGLL